MACKDESIVINGRNYYVVQLNPVKAIAMHAKLVKLGVPLISKLGQLKQGNKDALNEAVAVLFANNSEKEVTDFMMEIVGTAKVDGSRINVNEHFQGEFLPDFYKVFFWVLGVNFLDFFGGKNPYELLGKVSTTLKQKMDEELQKVNQTDSSEKSAQTLTGTSGGLSSEDSASSEN